MSIFYEQHIKFNIGMLEARLAIVRLGVLLICIKMSRETQVIQAK